MTKTSSAENPELTDGEIVELLFTRNQQAIAATEQKYRRYLYTVAYHIVNDQGDSEECLNDVYLALWDSIPPHRPHSLKAYLTTLTRRSATDIYRKRKRDRRVPDEMESSLTELEFLLCSDDSTEKGLDRTLLSEALNRFLANLSKEDRSLFICRYYLCMSVEEIAKATKSSRSRTYRLLEEIRKKLKEQLKKEGFYI